MLSNTYTRRHARPHLRCLRPAVALCGRRSTDPTSSAWEGGSSGTECLLLREAGRACREIQSLVNDQVAGGAARLAYREARLHGLLDAVLQGNPICLRNFLRKLIVKSEAAK